jgi:hypothetical protein
MKFAEVRDYIYDNPGSGIEEVCEATEVEAAVVHRWLQEGRLLLSAGSPITLRCEQCGAPILSGNKCDACLGKLRTALQDAAAAIKPVTAPPPKTQKLTQKQKEKMHVNVLNRKK